MLRLNVLAIVFIFISAPVGLLSRQLFMPEQELSSVLIGGIMLILLDVDYRWRNARFAGQAKWLQGEAGGQVVVVPVWGLGIVLLIYAVLGMTAVLPL